MMTCGWKQSKERAGRPSHQSSVQQLLWLHISPGDQWC